MIKNVIECNRCNKSEVYTSTHSLSENWYSFLQEPINTSQSKAIREFFHICPECSSKFQEFLKGQ